MKQGKAEGIDEAAAGLIRTARIRIDSMELMSFDAGAGKSAAPAQTTTPVGVDSVFSGKEGKQPKINITDNSAMGLPKAMIRIACSKGTYIRALARDLGEALGSGAHLDSLQRSRSGNFRVEDALSVDEALAILRTDARTIRQEA